MKQFTAAARLPTMPPAESPLQLASVALGGIMTAEDAIEFMMAGATAIEIGTANFVDPAVTIKVRDVFFFCGRTFLIIQIEKIQASRYADCEKTYPAVA